MLKWWDEVIDIITQVRVDQDIQGLTLLGHSWSKLLSLWFLLQLTARKKGKCRKTIERDKKPFSGRSGEVYIFLKEEIFIFQKMYTFLDLSVTGFSHAPLISRIFPDFQSITASGITALFTCLLSDSGWALCHCFENVIIVRSYIVRGPCI